MSFKNLIFASLVKIQIMPETVSKNKKVSSKKSQIKTEKKVIKKGLELMCTAKTMAEKYEDNAKVTSKYVHATSRGHEAIQLAVGMQLKRQDWVAPYYRDDSILLGIGMDPYEIRKSVV